ncbi:hypothetical protein M2120_001150 [Aurantimicrobium minutum]|nr:hypothetical protein [Aurantimicrobium minutum]
MQENDEEFELDDDALALAAGGLAPSQRRNQDTGQSGDVIYPIATIPAVSNFSTHHIDAPAY